MQKLKKEYSRTRKGFGNHKMLINLNCSILWQAERTKKTMRYECVIRAIETQFKLCHTVVARAVEA